MRSTLIDLIENHGADLFCVGNHGDFDAMVCRGEKNGAVELAARIFSRTSTAESRTLKTDA